MNTETFQKLLELNRQFYQTFAEQFSATRQRIQPGVRRVLARLPSDARILDLGCGNGELWRELKQAGFRGLYVGLDFSRELLSEAVERQDGEPPEAVFLQVDLSQPGWRAELPRQTFDYVLAFAVLHHLPGISVRRRVMESVHNLFDEEGRFIHSEWQFLNSRRLRERIQPWEQIGLEAEDVDPGDYLLDWRSGGRGLRYVHHFDLVELGELAEQTGFQVIDSFLSDGEGGQLGLYQEWKPVQA